MSKAITREHERLRRAAREYKREGYEVVLQPSNDQIPPFLQGLQPDLIAYGRSENVVVEVKTRSSLKAAKELTAFAKIIEDQPGWRFDLILTNPKRRIGRPEHAVLPELNEIEKRLAIAQELVQKEMLNSAMLLAWSSVEGLLRWLSHHEAPGLEGQDATRLLKELYALGVLTMQHYNQFQIAMTARHALVHGYSISALKPSDVTGLIEDAESLLTQCVKISHG